MERQRAEGDQQAIWTSAPSISAATLAAVTMPRGAGVDWMRRIVPRLRSPMNPAPSPRSGTSAHVMIWPAFPVAAADGASSVPRGSDRRLSGRSSGRLRRPDQLSPDCRPLRTGRPAANPPPALQ